MLRYFNLDRIVMTLIEVIHQEFMKKLRTNSDFSKTKFLSIGLAPGMSSVEKRF